MAWNRITNAQLACKVIDLTACKEYQNSLQSRPLDTARRLDVDARAAALEPFGEDTILRRVHSGSKILGYKAHMMREVEILKDISHVCIAALV